MNTKKIEAALKSLNELVGKGMEYPAAQWKVSCRFKLTEKQAEELAKAYDNQ